MRSPPWSRWTCSRVRLAAAGHRRGALPVSARGGGVEGLGSGFLVGRCGASEPELAELPGHLGADLVTFLLWQGAVDVASGLGSGFGVGVGCSGGGVESG